MLAVRLCHSGVIWEPEAFPLAAATQIAHGKTLYRDIWYDKPPLAPALYVLEGARDGWPLRTLGALYALLCSWLAWRFATDLWTSHEGAWAASLMAFFLTFDLPVSIIPIGPDLLMVAPHLAAVWLAWLGWSRRFRLLPLYSGILAGIAFLSNVKGLFVLASCAVFAAPHLLLLGFILTCAAAAPLVSIPGYIAQVWTWSSAYAAHTFVDNPLRNGAIRTLNWAGFHSALIAGMLWQPAWRKEARLWAWLAISFAGVVLGERFFPRYYLQLLPPCVILASRGIVLLGRKRWIPALLLLIPLLRFAPRDYSHSPDTLMDRDSRDAAALLPHNGTLFIWGYRPELWVYTRMPDATRFLDSQPLTCVPADRHLTQSEPVADCRAARVELAQSRPDYIADGLTPYNPRLAITNYPELADWFRHYELFARTPGYLLYRRIAN